MKKTLLIILLVTSSLIASAQLKVTSDGKVKIASNSNATNANLQVGYNSFGGNASNIGISGHTSPLNGKNNIGVAGRISANSNFSNDSNYGVLGVVRNMNYSHGRNYGLGGMIGDLGNHYGGAGIYATNYSYFLSYPDNIQGAYAGYFHGPVYLDGNLTTTNMFVPTDSRMSENVVSLNERGETNTLDNLLAMNVIEYNMKRKLTDEMPDGVKQEDTEELREAYEYLKKEDMEMSSRRHFGIDAEGLQKVYPDLVLEGQDGYLAVNYVELVPVLIRAIQELKTELDAVKGNDAERRAPSATDLSAANTTNNVLYQNTPNPFKEQTVIRFSLADDVQDAAVCIFDMTGKTIKKLPISSGMDNVSIGGYELGEGMFLYSLIVNGQIIDTKKMLITK